MGSMDKPPTASEREKKMKKSEHLTWEERRRKGNEGDDETI